jgi:hypothetical protein
MYGIKTVKEPTSVVYAAKCLYKREERLFLSRGKTVEIFSKDLKLLETIDAYSFVTLVCQMDVANSNGLLFITSELPLFYTVGGWDNI